MMEMAATAIEIIHTMIEMVPTPVEIIHTAIEMAATPIEITHTAMEITATAIEIIHTAIKMVPTAIEQKGAVRSNVQTLCYKLPILERLNAPPRFFPKQKEPGTLVFLLFWSFKFWSFEFVSNFDIRISDLFILKFVPFGKVKIFIRFSVFSLL
jgi:hypothetical protein